MAIENVEKQHKLCRFDVINPIIGAFSDTNPANLIY